MAEAEKDELSFEASAERLAAIVKQMESGELTLEQTLQLFEEGMRVSQQAQKRLDAAEKRVEELLGATPDGELRTRPFQ
jgi:exodeoxyribonuclease VII small subunit